MIRSKHNNLLNYFIYSESELSKEYVNKCKKFFSVKCPSIPLMCHPHGWPKGNPKYRNKEQGSSLKYTINGKKPHA